MIILFDYNFKRHVCFICKTPWSIFFFRILRRQCLMKCVRHRCYSFYFQTKGMQVISSFFPPPLQGRLFLRPPKPQRQLGGGQPGLSWVSLRVSSWVWGRVFSCPRKRERFSRRKTRRAQDRLKVAIFIRSNIVQDRWRRSSKHVFALVELGKISST